jgi:hypothetical protein
MTEEIVLDLGEYGEVVVESSETHSKGLRPASRGDEERPRRRVSAGSLLRAPLTGLGKLFMATLPKSSEDDPYELDEFTIEFELGLEAEAGNNLGAVAKIMPSGVITCTYTWKRKKSDETEEQT